MDLTTFVAAVGAVDPVTISGSGTRGGPVAGVRAVTAPAGIDAVRAAEMTAVCGAGTPVDELAAALAEVGQRTLLPAGGTVGGALASGRSDIHRLGRGPLRDCLLQARYVNSGGAEVKAGGPTVKNVSGFDLCRLLVGSLGTLGFLGEVVLRTWPIPPASQWFASTEDPRRLLAELYRPTALLWDGARTWVWLEGEGGDLEAVARSLRLEPVAGPPALPAGGRWSLPPAELFELSGEFVAELGVGIVHRCEPSPARAIDPLVRQLNERVKANFDPTGRLNPGVDVLAPPR